MQRITISSKYDIHNRLFSSSKFTFFSGYNPSNQQKIFIKAQERLGKLSNELVISKQCKAYQLIQGGPGIPSLIWCGQDADFNFLIIQHLNKQNIEQIFQKHKRKFSLKTILQIMLQLLETIRYLHLKDIIYNNINPRHILPGVGNNNHKLYLVDYFASSINLKPNNNLGKQKLDLNENLCFSSRRVNSGYYYSKSDDIQSFLYLLIYLIKGQLPWTGCQNINHVKIFKYKTQSFKNGLLTENLPDQIKSLACYVDNLKPQIRPDYQYIKNLIQKLAFKQRILLDNIFDWTLTDAEQINQHIANQIFLKIPVIDGEKQFLQKQYEIYLKQMRQSNNMSNLLSDTYNQQFSFSQIQAQIESVPERKGKQNCLLF